MDERELDRSIDVATQEMMAREPSRALGHNVMARVRGETRPLRTTFVWVTAAASLVVLCALAIALINRGPAALVPAPQSASPLVAAQPPAVAAAPVPVVREMAPARPAGNIRTPASSNVVSAVQLPPTDISPIEPIEAAPIALTAIDVPQLERETTSIATIDIEALTIEPLTASND